MAFEDLAHHMEVFVHEHFRLRVVVEGLHSATSACTHSNQQETRVPSMQWQSYSHLAVLATAPVTVRVRGVVMIGPDYACGRAIRHHLNEDALGVVCRVD